MEREVVGAFTLSRDDSLGRDRAVAVIEDNKVVVHKLPTPFRYYLTPPLAGLVGAAVWFPWGVAVGVVVGMIGALVVERWSHGRRVDRIRDGSLDETGEIIVKKGKTREVTLEDDGAKVRVEVPRNSFELSGGKDCVRRVYETLV